MSLQFSRRRWAESGDWQSVRSLITKMYKVEGRSLKEVMRIMETEHQFLATPKMYKKRIKDWAIDKNIKSDRLSTSSQSSQWRVAKQNDPRSSLGGTVLDAQRIANCVDTHPGFARHFQYDSLPAPEEDVQMEHRVHESALPPQQHNASYLWEGVGQTHHGGSNLPVPLGERDRTSALLDSIRDRFLEASGAITRGDTAGLFEILDPAYEAISNVAETESAQLLAVVADVFELLYRRPNHQDMLGQLLHYVFALVPDAARRAQSLSRSSQVLALLGRPGYDLAIGVPLDTANDMGPRPTASQHGCDFHPQPSPAWLALPTGPEGTAGIPPDTICSASHR